MPPGSSGKKCTQPKPPPLLQTRPLLLVFWFPARSTGWVYGCGRQTPFFAFSTLRGGQKRPVMCKHTHTHTNTRRVALQPPRARATAKMGHEARRPVNTASPTNATATTTQPPIPHTPSRGARSTLCSPIAACEICPQLQGTKPKIWPPRLNGLHYLLRRDDSLFRSLSLSLVLANQIGKLAAAAPTTPRRRSFSHGRPSHVFFFSGQYNNNKKSTSHTRARAPEARVMHACHMHAWRVAKRKRNAQHVARPKHKNDTDTLTHTVCEKGHTLQAICPI
jgi:hypothetical protein